METKIIEKAKLCEQAERYEDMAKSMKEYFENYYGKEKEDSAGKPREEPRNLLSVAYKNVVGTRRSSWRVLKSLSNTENPNQDVLDEYIDIIVKELDSICMEVIGLLDKNVLSNTDEKADESTIFFMKMKGDYYRYLAEVAEGPKREEQSQKANDAYNQANDKAQETLPPTHPIRLGLALNYSVFFYEIADKKDKACELAKKAFDDAIAELDTLKEDSYKDSTLIMQLLRDNLTLWTSTDEDEEKAA